MRSTVLQLFFPERCKGCGKPRIALCERCIARIPFATDLGPHTFAVFDYGNQLVRWAIRDLKYHRRSESALALTHAAVGHVSEYLGDRLQTLGSQRLIIVPVPEHPQKLRARGFNQSAFIAGLLAESLYDAEVALLVEKSINTLPQAHLSRARRLRNLAQSMHCPQPLDASVIYVVIDDVTTTGATFGEMRRALSAAGAKKIFAIALAHGYARK